MLYNQRLSRFPYASYIFGWFGLGTNGGNAGPTPGVGTLDTFRSKTFHAKTFHANTFFNR